MAGDLASVARVLFAPGTVLETLQRVVTLSVAAIDGCDEAGMCHTEPGIPAPVPTSAVIAELDRMQDTLGEGPCVDARSGRDSVYVADLTVDAPWPAFGPLATGAGLRSVLAYRLFAGSRTLGALQLYARLPQAFNASDRAQGLLFAAHAGIALDAAQAEASHRQRSSDFQIALASREIIGQAQGILMERERITASQAFELLRSASQRLNIKLRDVAQELVDTGAIPSPPPVEGHAR